VTETRNGQPVLAVNSATVIRAGAGVPEPDSISTQRAATAAGGTRDGDLVRIGGTIVGSVPAETGGLLLSVDDGSGVLSVLLDHRVQFLSAPYVAGALIRAAGVLVPVGNGTWRLKPRNSGDVNARYPVATVAEARLLEPGRTVRVDGIALNSWAAFSDSTLHLTDRQTAIRVVDFPRATFFSGDSVTVLATTEVRAGQPVLRAFNVFVERSGAGMPPLLTVSTRDAATANGGALDAYHVATSGVISAITPITQGPQAGDVILTVSDGSGPLEVLLDRRVQFPVGVYRTGQNLDLRGVLVPAPGGTAWQLKPRTLQEVQIR
jgi:hypothetical protein